MTIDFKVYSKPWEWGRGTDLVEIGPRLLTGQHWQPGFVFVRADAFSFAAGILSRRLSNYDPYASIGIGEEMARAAISDWRHAASHLASEHGVHRYRLLRLESLQMTQEVDLYVEGITSMLKELVDHCEVYLATNPKLCIHGL